jgi:hypothetical protein
LANQEDIKRWKKGRHHWNKWAKERLQEQERLQKLGRWTVWESDGALTEEAKQWQESAKIDFDGFEFPDSANFRFFYFPQK